jgi:hypothetical protein
VEKLEANREKCDAVAERQEAPDEEAAVGATGTLEDS